MMEKHKCEICGFFCEKKGSFLGHLETHNGAAMSCRSCHVIFQNLQSFVFHVDAEMCENKNIKLKVQPTCSKCPSKEKKCTQCKKLKAKNLKRCLQCNETFQFQRHYEKHLEGHKRNNCRHCSSLFTTRKDLMVHLADKHQIKLQEAEYPCKFCDRTFAKRKNLYYHYNQHADGQHVCLTCGKFLKTKEQRAAHEKKHEESKQWSCEKCNESFVRRQQYLQHIAAHEKYKCRECGKSFAAKNKLWNHKQTVHDIRCVERKHQCSECGQWFSRPTMLTLHFRIHTGEKPHECKICGKSYHTPRGYAQHMHSTLHAAARLLKCEECGLEFQKKHVLDRHVISAHKQELTFKCKYCDQKFNCKENMKRHLALHTEKRQFVCEHCAAAFHSLNALKDHISYVHSQAREYVCAQCGMSFKRNSCLNRHMASHSENRPFVCDCGNSYKRSSHLRRHKENVHGEVFKCQKLVRLSEDKNGALVPVEESPKPKENKRKKSRQQKNNASKAKENISKQEQPLFSSLLPPTPSSPTLHSGSPPSLPPPAPPPLPTTPPTLPSPPILDTSKVTFDMTSTILPLVDASEVENLQDICGRDSIITGNIDLTGTDGLTAVVHSTSDDQTISYSGNVLHTIVSYNLNDFSTSNSLSSISNAEPQLVFSSLPTSIALGQSQTVLTVTLDPLLESDGNLKHDDGFLQEKDGDGVGSLLLDTSVSSQLALDADPLYSVTSALITSADTTLNSGGALMSSSDTALSSTLTSSADASGLGGGSALLTSVDAGLMPDLQHSEVLLNLPPHLDSQPSPYSLSSSLNISVSDCESLLASQSAQVQTSPSLIHGNAESIGLDSTNSFVLPDYLQPNFTCICGTWQ